MLHILTKQTSKSGEADHLFPGDIDQWLYNQSFTGGQYAGMT